MNASGRLRKRSGVKPTQFRLDESYMKRLNELVRLVSAETGMIEDRTSVIRRLIAEAYRNRSKEISP